MIIAATESCSGVLSAYEGLPAMAADQRNMNLFTYVDDNAVSWNKRGEDASPASAVDGHAVFGAHPNWGKETPRHSVRKIKYQDPTTFRTKTPIFYTSAAYNLVALGDIIAVHVPGNVATVNYAAVKKIPERQPGAAAARQLGDHA
jgi:hypothetical protein